jgi:uncharacterized protein (DUF58 family)
MRRPSALLMMAVAAATASAATTATALFAIAVGLALLAASGCLTLALAYGRITVVRSLSTHEVQEDAPIRLQFDAQGKMRRLLRLEVEDHHGGWVTLRGARVTVELCVRQPGAHLLAPTRLRVRDAFGIFERGALAGHSEHLLILPAPRGEAPFLARSSSTLEDPVPGGLQMYAPGAPLARIHWPALARGAGLHVRLVEPSPEPLPLVVVDTDGAAGSHAVAWTARTAAGYIFTLARAGGCRVLLPGDPTPTTVTTLGAPWQTLHRRLATLGRHTPGRGLTAAGDAQALRVRAAAAPPLSPSPALPRGVLTADQCPAGG